MNATSEPCGPEAVSQKDKTKPFLIPTWFAWPKFGGHPWASKDRIESREHEFASECGA